MITLENVTLRRGKDLLLENIHWTIYPKQRIGIVGANGSGKSSLFLLLLHKLEADIGYLTISSAIKIAYMEQETPATAQKALDFVLAGDEEWFVLQEKLLQAEQEQDGLKIAALHEKLSAIDGYTAPARAAQLLAGLGFSEEDQQQSINHFSGGWRVRLNLAKALMCRSDVLLLDEPTNHLDLDALLWLEQWLKNYPGTILLISHDRDFLDQTVTTIAHITNHTIKLYTGDYSSYEKQRANALLLQQAIYEKQQKQLAHMQSYINRFRYKASKAKQAQSRLKAIERIEWVCAIQTESPFHFEFKKPKECPYPLLQLDHVSVGYAEKTVLFDLSVSIAPGERITLLGPNGAGKSTFIKLLAGALSPLQGKRIASPGLKIGYFAQHQVDQLQLAENALFHLRQLAEYETELVLRTFLGTFGFSGDSIFAPVGHFSGGEKSRLALALLVWQRPNLLLLDEPTNHLDLEMRQALSLALQEYEGAMLLVTHDRFLIRSTTDQLLLLADGQLSDFDGDLNEYQQWLFAYRKRNNAIDASAAIQTSRKAQRQSQAKQREQQRPLLLKIKQLEKALANHQQEAERITTSLTDAALYEQSNKNKLQQMLSSQIKVKKQIVETEHALLQAYEEWDQSQ